MTRFDDSGPLLGVWAHPDDEAFLSAGLMLDAVTDGRPVTVVHATRGEAGTPDPETWPQHRMAARRTREAAASLAALGVTDHRWMGYIDGTCHLVDDDEAAVAVAAVIDEVRPTAIVTFGPEGMTGHPDHQAVSRWTAIAAAASGVPDRVFHATKTQEWVDEWRELSGRFDIFFAGGPPITAPEDLAVARFLTEEDLDAKQVCLMAQSSQLYGLVSALGEDVFRRWIDAEWFVAAAG